MIAIRDITVTFGGVVALNKVTVDLTDPVVGIIGPNGAGKTTVLNVLSGFLVPNASVSDRRGLSYEQPYYWAISPSADLIVSPQINSKIAPFLNGQVRKRFYSGDVDVRFGYTHARDFDGKGNELAGTSTDRTTRVSSSTWRA